jgi:branched-chain amino acid transport system permease protein
MATRKTTDSTTPKGPAVREAAATGRALAARLVAARGWLAPIGGLLVVALLSPLYDALFGTSAGFQLHRLSLIGIFIMAALAQNILTGYAAQPSLGNAAFFGVGAYLLAWLTNDLGQAYWIGLLVAMAACAALGALVGGPALRISGAYLAIATLGLVFVTGALLDLWDTSAGRQSYDLNVLPAFLMEDHGLYFTIVAICALALFAAHNLLRSRVGRAWIAIRDNEAAAAAFGVNLTRYKLLAFVVSATLTGLAGALYATWATTASASMSSADQTIAFLAMIVVGGLGSIPGSALGAIFVGFLPLLLGLLPSPIVVGPLQIQVTTLTTGIYGILLLLALIFFPRGLSSLGTRARALFARQPAQTTPEGAP